MIWNLSFRMPIRAFRHKKERTDVENIMKVELFFQPSTYTHDDSYIVDCNCCVWHVSANEKVCLHLIELIMRNYIFLHSWAQIKALRFKREILS
jgi:vesicle coat complex subunit